MKVIPGSVVLSSPSTGSDKLRTPLENVKSYCNIMTKWEVRRHAEVPQSQDLGTKVTDDI